MSCTIEVTSVPCREPAVDLLKTRAPGSLSTLASADVFQSSAESRFTTDSPVAPVAPRTQPERVVCALPAMALPEGPAFGDVFTVGVLHCAAASDVSASEEEEAPSSSSSVAAQPAVKARARESMARQACVRACVRIEGILPWCARPTTMFGAEMRYALARNERCGYGRLGG